MKHLLSLLVVAASLNLQLAAQSCTPNTNLPDSIVFSPLPYLPDLPGSGIQDTACVGTPFATVFQVNVPTVFATQFGTFPVVSINVPTQGAFLDIPASMNYVCNPPNCIFEKDSVGCIVLYGTAQAGEEGQYDFGISIAIKTGPLLDILLIIPDSTIFPGNYYLHVKPAGYPNCQSSGTNSSQAESLRVTVRPNPLQQAGRVYVRVQESGMYQFCISDLPGRRLHTEYFELQPGEHSLPFVAPQLVPGMYVYTFGKGRGQAVGKILVLAGN